ncbi:MAG: anaerobic ribonucleoside-triphosphate reductase activating protein [Lachnospiraceae bacterium]
MRYHNITKDDMLNGDGLRTVLWLAGCGHCCPECQNPITWDPDGGLLFDQAAKEELFGELEKNYISGVTFSGGDPLYPSSRRDLLNLIREIKEKFPTKTMWLYTGYLWEEIKNLELVSYLDVLVDGEFLIDQRDVSLKWKGSANQRVIDVQKSLAQDEVILHD